MDPSAAPIPIPLVFGTNANPAFIRQVPTLPTGQTGAASYSEGFPPATFSPIASGGEPPFGQDFNGLMNQITGGVQWQQAGMPPVFNSAFSTSIGGYPLNAILTTRTYSRGMQWISTSNNNLVDPDTMGQTSWIQNPYQIKAGTPVLSFSGTNLPGCVLANSATIGGPGSNAGTSGIGTWLLYQALWPLSPSVCPVFTSAGAPTTRGANSIADFLAGVQLATPDMRGTGPIGVETSGSVYLSGVPVVAGNTTTPGSILGENLNTLTTAQIPSHVHANVLADPTHVHGNTLTDPTHNHTYQVNSAIHQDGTAINDAMISPISANTGNSATGVVIHNASASTGITLTNAAQGGGTSHNNVQRSTAILWNLKL